jgi:hypothetical protein
VVECTKTASLAQYVATLVPLIEVGTTILTPHVTQLTPRHTAHPHVPRRTPRHTLRHHTAPYPIKLEKV